MNNPFILCFISGMLTGMGNGSVLKRAAGHEAFSIRTTSGLKGLKPKFSIVDRTPRYSNAGLWHMGPGPGPRAPSILERHGCEA